MLPVEAQVKAHRLPVLNAVEEYKDTLTSIETGTADDCVTILAGGGASLKAAHDRVRKIGDCLDEKGLLVLRNARRAAGEVWNLLEAQGHTDLQPRVETLRELLSTESLFDSLSSIKTATQEILGAFRTLYEARHADRTEQFGAAIEKIKGREEWTAVPETMREPVLGPLQSRCCSELHLTDGSTGVQDLRGDVEPDGVGRGGTGRAVRPGGRPDPEAHHAARCEAQAGAGC